MPHEHVKPQSFHTSPLEAMKAPEEEFLYLARLHEGISFGNAAALVGGIHGSRRSQAGQRLRILRLGEEAKSGHVSRRREERRVHRRVVEQIERRPREIDRLGRPGAGGFQQHVERRRAIGRGRKPSRRAQV